MADIIPANVHPLLDPQFARAVVQQHFRRQLEALRETISFGSNLLLRLFKASWTDAGEAAGLGGLVRHAVAMADAGALALDGGAAPAALAIVRGVVEARIGVAWMMREGSTRWGRQFYVSTLRAERQWYRRLIPGSPAHVEYVGAYEEAYGGLPTISADEVTEAIEALRTIDALLETTEYAEINRNFDELVQRNVERGRRATEPEWYRAGPGALSSLADMATRLGLKVEYLNAYRYATGFSHGVHPHSHVRGIGEGGAEIVPIRDVTEFGTAMSIAVANLVCIYSDVVETFRPDELPSLRRLSTRWFADAETPRIRIERDIAL